MKKFGYAKFWKTKLLVEIAYPVIFLLGILALGLFVVGPSGGFAEFEWWMPLLVMGLIIWAIIDIFNYREALTFFVELSEETIQVGGQRANWADISKIETRVAFGKKPALILHTNSGLVLNIPAATEGLPNIKAFINNHTGTLGETQPDVVLGETQSTSTKDVPASGPKEKKFPGWLVVLCVLILVAIGVLSGYGSGMGQRYAAQNTQVTGQLLDQFRLALEAMDAGQYDIAKQHLEFIIQNDPGFPGAQDTYVNLLLRMQITPTLTPTQTPTITPTPDLRGVEEIYNQAVALLTASAPSLCERDWDGVIATLDSLRKADEAFHTAEVDGMYYTALYNRGICKIYPQAYMSSTTCSDLNINLEGGIYDLTLAERFAPLDGQADSLRTYARMYITGASFWDQDWEQVLSIFSQVKDHYPSLADSSCDTATERWRAASVKYAEQILATGDMCGAQPHYMDALSVNSVRNEPYYPTATAIAGDCGDGYTGDD